MNTIRSTWFGWGVLCVAGGGSYYFAKRNINADRAARHDAEMQKQARLRKLESYEPYPPADAPKRPKKKDANVAGGTGTGTGTSPDASSGSKGLDHAANPSSEASEDSAAPVGHAPTTNGERLRERSKYEAAVPYRHKGGDRFS